MQDEIKFCHLLIEAVFSCSTVWEAPLPLRTSCSCLSAWCTAAPSGNQPCKLCRSKRGTLRAWMRACMHLLQGVSLSVVQHLSGHNATTI